MAGGPQKQPASTPGTSRMADIEMEEGWRLFSWITNCDPANVSIGMDVTVTFAPGADGEVLPVFEPAEHPS